MYVVGIEHMCAYVVGIEHIMNKNIKIKIKYNELTCYEEWKQDWTHVDHYQLDDPLP